MSLMKVEGEVHTRYRKHVVSLLNSNGVTSFIPKLDEVAIDHMRSYTEGEPLNSAEKVHQVNKS